jgi:hypothetical protein
VRLLPKKMMFFVLDGAVGLAGFVADVDAVVSAGAVAGAWLLLLQADSIRMIGQIT